MTRKKVGILDYGVGNIASVQSAFERLGYQVVIGNSESSFSNVSSIILPGVGSFAFAMQNLRDLKMDKFLERRFEEEDVDIIGICLGMQILFDYSEEGQCEGLGLIKGNVLRFKEEECHVGWNIVSPLSDSFLLHKSAFYFNHSYYVSCPKEVILATANYQLEFPVAVKKKRFYGFQFHPEKSQNMGAGLIKSLMGD